MKMFLVMGSMISVSLSTVSFGADQLIGTCEGITGDHTAGTEVSYLLEITRRAGKVFAQPKVLHDRRRSQVYVAVAAKTEIHDASFEDAGEGVSHHLINRGMDFDSRNEASVYVSYSVEREGQYSMIDAIVEFKDRDGNKIALDEANCTFSEAEVEFYK